MLCRTIEKYHSKYQIVFRAKKFFVCEKFIRRGKIFVAGRATFASRQVLIDGNNFRAVSDWAEVKGVKASAGIVNNSGDSHVYDFYFYGVR